MHESFLRHARFRYLKLACGIGVVSILVYAWHSPDYGPNGGTWLGYTLGTIGALLILWLTGLGVRKRRYRSSLGTQRGWTSAHVYLGLVLLLVATLHTGFQFGWNVHTLAYALMVAVILSGVYGVIAYSRYPRLITENRAESNREAWLAEIFDLNQSAVALADRISPEVHRIVVRAVSRQRIGGSWRQQVRSGTAEDANAELLAVGDILRQRLSTSAHAPIEDAEQRILFTTVQIMVTDTDPAIERLKQLLDLLTRRNELINRINRDIQAHARMQVWLYLHVPLTAGLLAALLAHVVSVFLYW